MSYIGEIEIVYASASGKVQWEVEDGREVGPNEVLGFVRDEKGEEWNIRSLLRGAKGILTILPKVSPEVGIGESIAYITITAILI